MKPIIAFIGVRISIEFTVADTGDSEIVIVCGKVRRHNGINITISQRGLIFIYIQPVGIFSLRIGRKIKELCPLRSVGNVTEQIDFSISQHGITF